MQTTKKTSRAWLVRDVAHLFYNRIEDWVFQAKGSFRGSMIWLGWNRDAYGSSEGTLDALKNRRRS